MKILISHVFGTHNKGDWILVSEIIKILNNAFPGAKIYAITRDPESQAAVFPELVWIPRIETSFQQNKLLRNIDIVMGLLKILAISSSKFLFNLLRHHEPSLEIIDSADLVVMCPGGYWDYSHPSFISNIINLRLLVSCKKKMIWAPQSIERIKNPLLERMFADLLSKAELIFAREEETYNYVNSLKIEKNKILQVPDLAFYHLPDKSHNCLEKITSFKRFKFIACTALNWHFPNSNDPQLSHKRYVSSIAEAAKYFYNQYGLPMLLVRQIGTSKDGSGDINILREIQEISDGCAHVIEDDLHPDELIEVISKSLFLIGSRMHSNIFALISSRPVVAISYQKKTEGIMKMVSLEDYIIPIDTITSDVLIRKAQNVYDSHEELSVKIHSKVNKIKLEKHNLIRTLQ